MILRPHQDQIHLAEPKLRPKVGDMLVPNLTYISSLVLSKTLWYLGHKESVKTIQEFLPNPSSVFANLVAVKGIHVENGLVFSYAYFCPNPLAIAKQKARA